MKTQVSSTRVTTDPKWNTSEVQYFQDHWRGGAIRTLRFMGKCVCCGKRTYAFDDDENDPRGILGDHAASVLYAADCAWIDGVKEALESRELSADAYVPACFECMNEEPSYKQVVAIARKNWGTP